MKYVFKNEEAREVEALSEKLELILNYAYEEQSKIFKIEDQADQLMAQTSLTFAIRNRLMDLDHEINNLAFETNYRAKIKEMETKQ